jgi:hypothetical protein
MKSLIAISILFGAASSFACGAEKTVSFGYYNQKAMYACSYAENQAKSDLKAMGAVNVQIKCTGGIEAGSPNWMPLEMDITFDQNCSDGQTVTIKGNESCDFNVRLMDTLLTQVDHKSVDKSESCWDASGAYKYNVAL